MRESYKMSAYDSLSRQLAKSCVPYGDQYSNSFASLYIKHFLPDSALLPIQKSFYLFGWYFCKWLKLYKNKDHNMKY